MVGSETKCKCYLEPLARGARGFEAHSHVAELLYKACSEARARKLNGCSKLNAPRSLLIRSLLSLRTLLSSALFSFILRFFTLLLRLPVALYRIIGLALGSPAQH